MTIESLELFGSELLNQNFSELDTRTIWTAATILFFGSFRIGEILSQSSKSFDPLTTLLWGDVKFFADSVRIHVRFPKIFAHKGISIDLFPIKNSNLCPVKCLVNLCKFVDLEQSLNNPVFVLDNSDFLTPSLFNKILRTCLSASLGKLGNLYSSHSFRAGIPSSLSSCPEIANNSDIKLWGRWDSDSYSKYTRHKSEKRKKIFYDICSVLGL
jgi:hypothetical protein